MTSGTALKQGFCLALRVRSAVWVLFLSNLGIAAVAGLPIYQGLLRFTGHSLMSHDLAAGFSVDWLTDFSMNSPGSLERYAAVIALFGLLSIAVNTVLAGGVLACFRGPDRPFSLIEFCHSISRYAWRLIRLTLIGLVCYWIVFRVLNQGLGKLIEKWIHDWPDDRAFFAAQLGVGLLVLLGLVFVNLVMDYARVRLVIDDGSSAAEAFLASLGFTVSRLRKALTVYALPSLAGIAVLGIYWLVVPWSLIHAPVAEEAWGKFREPLTVALLFIGQQVVMFGRYWFRVATWASEWSYYSSSR